jgi:hypothetical protein
MPQWFFFMAPAQGIVTEIQCVEECCFPSEEMRSSLLARRRRSCPDDVIPILISIDVTC